MFWVFLSLTLKGLINSVFLRNFSEAHMNCDSIPDWSLNQKEL